MACRRLVGARKPLPSLLTHTESKIARMSSLVGSGDFSIDVTTVSMKRSKERRPRRDAGSSVSTR
eukprot:CAMPEP_0185797600 /NCGR_PEP_ID=MMETSP1174-20130828/161705_1 /TAXON_ID=35687 /ORGANISM="Dictyocha speculum, Strain CCMP1381" /LENGTH=64 /DNA_ID=CAMNT_0028493045 /DNA_START=696 /DNA_END=886 /DNA_ORIENTATION=+